MQRFYQTEWQNIQFSSCAPLSYLKMADAAFYAKFYKLFFKKYQNYLMLPESWQLQKKQWAYRALECLPSYGVSDRALATIVPSVLSVGCGIGYVEHIMLKKIPAMDLHVTEVTDVPLRWIRPLLKEKHCYIGYIPECLPQEQQYDLILCGTIDYAMTNATWLTVLRALRAKLKAHGRICVLSASVLSLQPQGIRERFHYAKNECKAFLKHCLGIAPQQFWGYMRTVDEYKELMQEAGYANIETGPLGDDPHCMAMTGTN